MRLTARGVVFLLAATGCLVAARIFTIRELVFVACLLAAVPVVGYVLLRARRFDVTAVRRTEPELLEAHRPADVTVTFANRSATGSPAARWSDLRGGVVPDGMPLFLPPIAGYKPTIHPTPPESKLTYRIDSPVRGVHTFGPILVRIADPFGVVTRSMRLGEPETVVITPYLYTLPRVSAELVAGVGNDRYAGRIGPAGDIDVLARKYQTGDSMRRVNWPATARHGELMVRQDDQHGAKDGFVLVDSDPSSYPGAVELSHGQDEIEWAISIACSVAVHILLDGFTLAFAASFRDNAGPADASINSRPVRRVHTYTAQDQSQLLLDAATIRRDKRDSEADRGQESDAAATARSIIAVLGAGSDVDSLPELPYGRSGGLALVVIPADTETDTLTRAAHLVDQLRAASWRARVVRAGDDFSHVWADLGPRRVAA